MLATYFMAEILYQNMNPAGQSVIFFQYHLDAGGVKGSKNDVAMKIGTGTR